MTIFPLGDTALVINFKQKISQDIHRDVLQLVTYLKRKNIEGIAYFIPAYCSITVVFDPEKWNFEDLSERLYRMAEKIRNRSNELPEFNQWNIPVCYDEEFGLDLASLADEKKIDAEQIIQWHLSKTYHVYMLGFLPGFVYLGDLDKKLQCQRKNEPRTMVPAQSVAIAGAQTGIYPLEGPGGWQIIGKTPIPIFLPSLENPFLFHMGDRVTFKRVDKNKFDELSAFDFSTLRKHCLIP